LECQKRDLTARRLDPAQGFKAETRYKDGEGLTALWFAACDRKDGCGVIGFRIDAEDRGHRPHDRR